MIEMNADVVNQSECSMQNLDCRETDAIATGMFGSKQLRISVFNQMKQECVQTRLAKRSTDADRDVMRNR
ncbi:hypothetical protein CKO09_03830 [Chromatium weissei]|nr:hypothetical protein [Chromatium weissei]